MQFLRRLGRAFVRVVCSLGRITLLLLWVLLLALFYVQLQVATLDGLDLPRFAKDALQDHLAALGLRVNFSHARFDTAGRILVEDVSVGDPKIPGALVTAKSVTTRVNPWLLLVGEFDLHDLQVNDATLFRPLERPSEPWSSHAPAFTAVEKVAQALNVSLQFTRRDLLVPQLTGQVGVVAVTARGGLRLPPTTAGPLDLKAVLAAYEAFAIGLSFWDDGVHLLEPHVGIVLKPADRQIAFADVEVDSNGYPAQSLSVENGAGFLHCGPLHLTTTVPLIAPESDPVEVSGTIEHCSLPKLGYDIDGRIRFNLRGDFRRPPHGSFPGPNPTWYRLDAALNSITSHPYNFSTGPVAATISLDQGLLSAEAGVQLAGSPWSVKAEFAAIGSGQVDKVAISGPVDNASWALFGKLAGHDLGSVVQFDGPARLDANVTLSDEGKFSHAEGRIAAGPVRCAGVPLDAAAGHFAFQGVHLLCDEVFLQTGTSSARGTYEMDTSTLDYRFLLTGQAQPSAIAGWFGDWWPDFWNNFGFRAPPTADVDLQGRWGSPELTSVVVGASAKGATVRGSDFDEVRTRVFIRPGWDNVLGFSASQGARSAQGAATLEWDERDGYLHALRFDLTTDLDSGRLTGLLGPAGVELIAPYGFAEPPRITLAGRLEGESATGWGHTTLDLGIESTGGFAYYGFPVRDLSARVQVRDETVDVPALAFGFAGGQAAGSARVWTAPGQGRQLSLTGRLTSANLGETIQTLENFSAARQGRPAPAASQFQQRLASGRLNLTLAAEGAPTRPPRLHGQGHADVTGTDLGQIQLFGLLSDLLNHTLLNFSSLSLDTLHADFALDGEKVSFPGPLTLSGPRATVDATGAYQLDSKQLDFKVKIQPRTPLTNLFGVVIKPIESVLEVKLQGTLEHPDWVFVLGPTNLLRNLTGTLDQNREEKK